MSKIGGINKMMNNLNRSQQKRDWRLLLKKAGKELAQPDWNLSVKKIDTHIENICKENNIDFKEICGVGN